MSKSFIPPKRILMGPGPSDVHPRILEAMSRPTIGHLDPEFIKLMDEIKSLLQWAFQTQNKLTLPISAPGSAGMESCFVNLVEPGDDVLICENGVFGGRMKENVLRLNANPILLKTDWGRAVDPNLFEDTLKNNPKIKTIAFVHAETSTGALSDAKTLCEIAKKYNCITIVDAVTSLGAVPLFVDDWKIDAIYSGSQKALSCTPGLSPVSFSSEAIARIQKRKSKCTSWFLDLNLIMNYWGGDQKRAYHHTAPINPLYGLHEALLILKEESLESSWKKHQTHHAILKEKLEKLGFEFLVPESERLPHLNTVKIPSHLLTKEAELRSTLLTEYSIEVGAGLGSLAGKVWRIGIMGNSCTSQNIDTLCNALERIL